MLEPSVICSLTTVKAKRDDHNDKVVTNRRYEGNHESFILFQLLNVGMIEKV